MKSIKEYLIEAIANIEEFKIFSRIADDQLQSIKENTEQLIDDQFIDTATQKGIARREKLLNIQPFADDNLETRKFRVKANWNNQLPYTYRQLEAVLNNMAGENGYKLERNLEEYTLTVKINLGQKRMLQDADNIVRKMSPCNLIITVELQYNRYIDLAQFTHVYLSNKTHTEIKEEVL